MEGFLIDLWIIVVCITQKSLLKFWTEGTFSSKFWDVLNDMFIYGETLSSLKYACMKFVYG